ncbi:T9SS type A sorting domain-containing protein [Peijinzhouia sedimentorum]
MIKTFTNYYKYLVFSVLLLLVIGFNQSVYSQTATAPVGDGSSGNPYQIATLENLYWIATTFNTNLSKHYLQTADIDASSTTSWTTTGGTGWMGIATYSDFIGTYDGGGYSIRNLYTMKTSFMNVGLFGTIGVGGIVKNLRLVNTRMTGFLRAGALAAEAEGAIISNVISVGGTVSAGSNVGGLVGQSNLATTITNCYSSTTVSGSGTQKGGLSGNLLASSVITNSYSIGQVSGTGGGLVGSITSSTVTNSFYNSETSGKSDTGKGVPKTTAQLKTLATFTTDIDPNDWDFTAGTGVWAINPTGYISYPYLQGFTYDVPGTIPAVNPILGLEVSAPTSYEWAGGTDEAGEAGNWDNGLPPTGADIVIPEGAIPYPVFEADIELGNITIEPNATLTMAPSFRLDITEDSNITIGAGGKLILKSDGTGTAYIGSFTGTSTITGTVLQERYIMGSNRSFRFMGHPFNSAIPLSALGDKIDITGPGTGFTPTATNEPSAFYYDPVTGDGDAENDGGWTAFTAMDDSWERYQGIRVLVRGSKGQAGSFDDIEYTPDAVTFEWEGEVNTGTQTIMLEFGFGDIFDTDEQKSDFNLVGNPFPSAINLKAISRSAGMVVGSFYIWQPRESPSGTSGRGGAYLTEPFDTGNPTFILPTGGAFFIRSSEEGTSITIEEADKVSSNEPLQGSAGSTLRMDSNVASKYGSNSIQLVLSSEDEWWDRSLVFFKEDGVNTSQDREDASKLANPEVNLFTVSSDDFAMAIDARPYQEAEGVETNTNHIPLHILSPARAYTLSLPDFDLEEGRTLRLYDRFTEEYITLAKGTTYGFEVTEDPSTKGHRFDIVMGIEVITSINPSGSRFQAFLLPNPAQEQVRISIQKPDHIAETTVKIVSMAGVEVSNEKLTTETTELDINLSQLSKGIYLVEITHGTERIVKRLIVN